MERWEFLQTKIKSEGSERAASYASNVAVQWGPHKDARMWSMYHIELWIATAAERDHSLNLIWRVELVLLRFSHTLMK